MELAFHLMTSLGLGMQLRKHIILAGVGAGSGNAPGMLKLRPKNRKWHLFSGW